MRLPRPIRVCPRITTCSAIVVCSPISTSPPTIEYAPIVTSPASFARGSTMAVACMSGTLRFQDSEDLSFGGQPAVDHRLASELADAADDLQHLRVQLELVARLDRPLEPRPVDAGEVEDRALGEVEMR